MTDRPTPDPDEAGPDAPALDADAELASALHDDEASPAERARAGEPAVQAHRRTFAAVAAQVGDVPAPPAGLVDEHVAAALDAFDEGGGVERSGGGDVVPLADRRPWWQRAPLGAVAAAIAVVALVGAIGFAAVNDDGDDQDTATAALDADEGGDAADDATSEAFRADDGAGAGSGGIDRATYADVDELAAELARQVREQQTAAGTTAAGDGATTEDAAVAAPAPEAAPGGATTAEACDAIGAAGLDPGTVRLVWSALVADRPVTAVVHGPEDELRLVVVDELGCEVVDDRDL